MYVCTCIYMCVHVCVCVCVCVCVFYIYIYIYIYIYRKQIARITKEAVIAQAQARRSFRDNFGDTRLQDKLARGSVLAGNNRNIEHNDFQMRRRDRLCGH